MRLKTLELQGYKTFATRTEFLFDGGITAIVGPNGSGKSNIADAIRWVLGEQSFRALRGRRTEDMIFSGSAQRSRLGMASATLCLDNADGWLPIEFVEVSITRRAYRSGENEYLLNGSRVRLRDVTELLSQSGLAQRTYAVIGQGLVDAVLSLRAEDRRALFEEAAGIALYQSRRSEALDRMEQTQANLQRVSDIVGEIVPRLQRLEREAERAQQAELLNRQLEGLLRTWYGYRWRQVHLDLVRARDAVARREGQLARLRDELAAIEDQAASLHARQRQLRDRLGSWRDERNGLHRQLEVVERDLAVWQERARLLRRQSDDLSDEVSSAEAALNESVKRVDQVEAELASSECALRDSQDDHEQARLEFASFEERRASIVQQVAQKQTHLLDLRTEVGACESRATQIDSQRADLVDARRTHRTAIAAQQERLAELRLELESMASARACLDEQAAVLDAEASRLREQLGSAKLKQEDLNAALVAARTTSNELLVRRELLARLRAEGGGLGGSARVALQASSGRLPGAIGTLAELLHVPPEWEVPIAAALGPYLQAIVVETWSHAAAAIEFLSEGARGRATFLPLDSVRPAPRLAVPVSEGVLGLGAEVVTVDPRLRPIAELLLSRTLIVRDLAAARSLLPNLPGEYQVVTLSGELVESAGSVTGGRSADDAQSHALAREREWREMPGRLDQARQACHDLELELAEVQAVERRTGGELAAAESKLEELQAERNTLESRSHDLDRQIEVVTEQTAWREDMITQSALKADELEAAASASRAEGSDLAQQADSVARELERLQAQLDTLRGDGLYSCLSDARTRVAVAEETWRHRQAVLSSLKDQHADLARQLAARRERVEALRAEGARLARQIEEQSARVAVTKGWIATLDQKITPALLELEHLEDERAELRERDNRTRSHLRDVDGRHMQALASKARHQDRQRRLREQIADDFGLVEFEPLDGVPDQPPLPLAGLVSTLHVVEVLPEGLEEEVHQIKAQIKRMGSVNPNAPEEFAQVQGRYTFLTEQASDLRQAIAQLREVIAELDDIMRAEFGATFRAVAARFRDNFTRLFDGGTARLVLTEPDDLGSTGVDIVAHPPGKRQQRLAMLSGGERALTAAALIFALLETNPPPFCVLDEVDAMLDESNIRRFRQLLEGLAKRTQFIVITHNRGTIQVADTIYGVSMGDDSVSQVVSLRLDGDRLELEDTNPQEPTAG